MKNITVPELGESIIEGTLTSWLIKEGDSFESGDNLAEIETDKATMEFESFYSGKLLHIGVEVGQTAAVDTLLAIIGPEGTDVNQILSKNQENPVKKDENYNFFKSCCGYGPFHNLYQFTDNFSYTRNVLREYVALLYYRFKY